MAFADRPPPSLAGVARLRLAVMPPHPCHYLPGRQDTTRAFCARELDPEMYHALMDQGFRRSGRIIYQPVCQGCNACVQLRVPAGGFSPGKSQRRCHRRNADLSVHVGRPQLTDEKRDLYLRYQQARHAGDPTDTLNAADSLREFLYESPVNTLEFTYRFPGGELAGAGICDLCRQSLSSVYFYFDPSASHRSLGVFSALTEIAFAHRQGVPFYYLGFWVAGCPKMAYKTAYHPYELLGDDGAWRQGG